jgi:hypothetical protein
MPSATPTWLPLIVAAVGVGGTLAATILTQVLIGRRDRRRWTDERSERRDQWRREDAARWLADRRAAYTELLAALHEQHGLLIRAGQLAQEGRRLEEASIARLEQLREVLQRSRQAAALLASPAVGPDVDAVTGTLIAQTDRVLTGAVIDPGSAMTALPDRLARLRDDMRADLAPDPG